MRVGIFGGSFDPVHLAHLIHAEQCREQAQLERVFFVPAARPPHKRTGPLASFAERTAMLRLAIAEQPAFSVDTCEENRPGPSYTVETLRFVRAREPGNQFFLIIGSDSVRDLGAWREPEEIARLCTLLIVQRPGFETVLPTPIFQYQLISSPLLDISSSAVRQQCLQGKSILYLVPETVRNYIQQHHLYATPGP
jgi:nicotinate-nucleotide adenylyltransferase